MEVEIKATVFTRFGPPEVLQLIEARRPVPGPDEVLIKVHATTVTTAESQMRRGRPLWGRVIIGLRSPRRKIRTLGLELAGEIAALGNAVDRFAPGDRVFGFTGFSAGANAEYTCMRATGSLDHMPTTVGYGEAAALADGPTTALFFLRDKANVQPGQQVLINGASGSVGTYAVQLAKHFGAQVTAVCSERNTDLVTSLGADAVIDYNHEDFTDRRGAYDVIFDAVGTSSFLRCRQALTNTGCYMSTTGLVNGPLAVLTAPRRGRRVKAGMSVDKRVALAYIRELVEADKLRVVIDRRYPLEQIVEAHRYVDAGHKRGNVSITVADRA